MGAMTDSPGRITGTAAALTLLASALTGCGLLAGSSDLEDALEYLPGDSTTVTFVHRAAVAERVGLEDLSTPASDEEMDQWVQSQLEEGYGTELANWVQVMQDAAFSDLDVVWEAVGSHPDRAPVRVWKLDDGIDVDEVADDLEDAGYERGEDGDVLTFEITLDQAEGSLYGDRYPAVLQRLALVPDERLVLSGDVELAIDVAEDDVDSLSDEGSLDDLLDHAADLEELEYAGLQLDPACGPAGGQVSPEVLEREYDGLAHPDAGLALFSAPDELLAVRSFDDEDTAAGDAEGLETWLAERAPATGFEADLDVRADGSTVLAEGSFDDDRRILATAWVQRGGPFSCPPAS